MIPNIIFSLIGGLIFSTGDMAHVAYGIATYSSGAGPFFLGIPWWVPVFFSSIAFLLIKTFPFRKRLFKIPDQQTEHWVAGASFLCTLILYWLSSFIPETYFIVKNVIMFLLFFAQMFFLGGLTLSSILEMILIAASGCGFEALLGALGIFKYVDSPSLFGLIPVWLVFVYASVTLTIRTWCTSASQNPDKTP